MGEITVTKGRQNNGQNNGEAIYASVAKRKPGNAAYVDKSE